MALTASPSRALADLARGVTVAELTEPARVTWFRSPRDTYAHHPQLPGLPLPIPTSLSTAGVQHASCTRVVSTLPAHPAMQVCPECVSAITVQW